MIADVYMQGGDVLHQPDAKTEKYTPFQGAQVSLEGEEKETREDGSTEVFTIDARPDETYTALVTANNRNISRRCPSAEVRERVFARR